MNKLKRICVACLFVLIGFMWLKELTERRAMQAADRFMGPALEQFGWLDNHFVPWFWDDTKGKRHGFSWNIRYDERFIVSDFPLVIEVDLLGRVRSTSYEQFERWMALSDTERRKDQMKWSEVERKKLCPKI